MFGSVLKNCLLRQPVFRPRQLVDINARFMSSLNTSMRSSFNDIRCTFINTYNIGNNTNSTPLSIINESVLETDPVSIANEGMLVDSVKRKRKKMMKKHKLRKRRKSAKAERRKKNQGN